MNKESPKDRRISTFCRGLWQRVEEMSPLEQGLWAVTAILAIVAILVLVSPPTRIGGAAVVLPSSTRIAQNGSLTRTLIPAPVATSTPGPTSYPVSSQEPLDIPTPPSNAVLLTFSPSPDRTGWVGSKEPGPHWRDGNLHSGMSQGQAIISLIQFDLTGLAPGSRTLYAALEITGRDAKYLGHSGEWRLDLVNTVAGSEWDDVNYDTVRQAVSLVALGNPLAARDLEAGQVNRFVLQENQLPVFEKQSDDGIVTFRLSGPSEGSDNLFTWEAGPGIGEPTLYVVAVPASFVVITLTPTPEDVYAAATYVARQTEQVRLHGTPTPFPRSIATATPGATSVAMVTSVPTAANLATATAQSVYATAVAATTGTFTPTPRNWVTPTSTPTRPLIIPRESLTPVPTPTAGIVRPGILELAKMPLPPGLYDKIAFLEGPRQNPNVWIMDPDGTHVALLTDRLVHDAAKARDAISPDGTIYVYQGPDRNGRMQLWGQNLNFPAALPEQLTFERNGQFVYGQAWSPDGKQMAYVSDEMGTQDIWIYTLQPKSWKRLTNANAGGGWWNQFPSWSPDGKQIVFSSDSGHNATFSEIWVMNADGTAPRNLGNGVWDAYNPVWIKWHE